jgi:hypothetical protein
MMPNYIPLNRIPEEISNAAQTLHVYFETQGLQEWEFSYVADRRLVIKLERERDAALAANAELLERLRERTESHLAASARDVQTIQQQAVEIDRLKSVLADIYSLSRS